jgi:epoxyqueuosine reductase
LKDFTKQLKEQAHALGFVLANVTLAAEPSRLSRLHYWLDAGFAGQMRYISERRDAYQHPAHVLEGCRSLLMLALPYLTDDQQKQASPSAPGRARVARYAQGEFDYHDVIHARLKTLVQWAKQAHPTSAVRGVVDTAPLLEREFAERAGLGWVGKNTLLLNRRWGSYFFLAALLTDLELAPDEPDDKSYCGTCTACLDRCPTQAFPAPYVLDATRCISYLTIEHRDAVPEDVAEQFGDWAFGCDVCQEVCPWNRKASVSPEDTFKPHAELAVLDILETLALDEAAFKERFRLTPLWRSKRRGIIRNAILVAGNQRLIAAEPLLQELLHDPELLIRQASQWALGKLAMPEEK